MRKLPNVFSREQVNKLVSVIDEPWLMVAVLIALFCGLRRREVINLCVQNVDISEKRVRIENSKNPNKSFEGYGKDRIVPLPDCLVDIVQRWIEILGPNANYLFPSLKDPSAPISGEHLFRTYKKALGRANLDPVVKIDAKGLPRHLHNFHTLRHTYATLLWEKTGDIVTVKHALGHVKLATTMIYTHVTNRVVEQKVNEAFASRNSPKQTFSDVAKLDPLGILMRRLAMGEIDTKTFKQLREELRREHAAEKTYIG